MLWRREGQCDGCKRPGVEPAQCCRVFEVVDLSQLLSQWTAEEQADYRRWASYHEGVELRGDMLLMHSPCRQLTEDGRCAIYGEHPDLCKIWPALPEDLECFSDCAFRFVEVEEGASYGSD